MIPTVVSYYTKNTPYEDEVKHLIASCEKFGIPYEIEGIPNLGSWEKNCCYKPQFILEKMEKINGPLLWVDADGVFVRWPKQLETLTADVGLCIIEELPDLHPCKMITGTIFFNNTKKGKELLIQWLKACQNPEDEEFPDQVALKDLLLNSNAEIFNLSTPYFTTHDLVIKEEWARDAVIVHFQASRTLKKVLNHEIIPFWDNEKVTTEKRKILETCIPQ